MVMEEKYIELLKSYQADNHKHGSRQLLDHLVGTYNILKNWNVGEDVCIAGLFHSIYGTEFHLQAATELFQRDIIQEAIGERAEFLAYVFCVTKRFDLFQDFSKEMITVKEREAKSSISLSIKDVLDLLVLELANLIEQVDYFESISPVVGQQYLDIFERGKDKLPICVSKEFQSFVDKHHPNLLIRPAMYGDIVSLRQRLVDGCPVNEYNNDNRHATALLYATVYNQVDAVKVLLDNGADLNIADKYGNLPLDIAKKNGCVEIISLLEEIISG